ncbi:MAG: MmcQ/YjbR family DNA-binding protein [Acidobacteria bacterium]|nr:MmcQ/YjbR family DNA-binding protein [Acidobacteriota bacterium]
MTLETLRSICLGFPGATEDIKWGADLAFSVGAKMFCVVYLEPPHHVSFKCTPEDFAELVERPGLRPAPYLGRAMWVQEEALGETLDRAEMERLLRAAYDLVAAKLPKSKRAVAGPAKAGSDARKRRGVLKARGARKGRTRAKRRPR